MNFTRGLFYILLFENNFRVSSRIWLGKTRTSSSFNSASVLLRKKSHIFSSAESISKLIVLTDSETYTTNNTADLHLNNVNAILDQAVPWSGELKTLRKLLKII